MSGTLKLNDTVFATENNGAITTDASTIKVGGTTVVDSNRVVDVSEMKVGGNTVIDSNRAMDVSEVKVGGTTVVDSNRKMTGVDIVSTSSMTFRNKIINGDMRICQRYGLNYRNAVAGNYYTLDRWGHQQYQQAGHEQILVDDPDVSSKYALRVSSSSTSEYSGGTRMECGQMIESVNCEHLAGKTVTLSYMIKFSHATMTSVTNTTNSNYGGFYTGIYCYTSVDPNFHTTAPTVGFAHSFYDGSLPTIWTKKTLTYTIPSDAKTLAVRTSSQSLGSTTNNSDYYYDITDVQLEEGPVATPFEHRPYGLELSLCQRYFETSFNPGYSFASTPSTLQQGAIGMGCSSNSMSAYERVGSGILFKTIKHHGPTIKLYAPATHTLGAGTQGDGTTDTVTLSALQASQGGFNVTITSGTLTTGYKTIFIQYTAEAEL